jgi:hypothetical protein
MWQVLRGPPSARSQSGPVRYKRSDGVSQAEHAGHIVLLGPTGARYYGVDEVGARIWTLLSGSITSAEIVERITSEYEASRDDIQRDVSEFLDRLAGARLIDVAVDR